mgnify:CR=1 FL=1
MASSTSHDDIKQAKPETAQDVVDFYNGIISIVTSPVDDMYVDELVEYLELPKGTPEGTYTHNGQVYESNEYFLVRILDVASKHPLVANSGRKLELRLHEGRKFLLWAC